MEKMSTPSSIAISKAIMPTVKYSFLAIEMSLNHRKTDLFIFQVLRDRPGGLKIRNWRYKTKGPDAFRLTGPAPSILNQEYFDRSDLRLACKGFLALYRDRIKPGYNRGVSGDIQQAGQVIPEIPEKIQTCKTGGYNG